MDCKYVRQSICLCFTFHPLASSLFYLTNTKNRLRIIEQNLYTGLVKNQFAVPLKQQNMNVDNFILNYSPQAKQVVLTLSNQILVYSLELKTLIFVGEATQNKNPCFIQKAVVKKGFLFFSATEYSTLFVIKLSDCIKAGTITNYVKYKMPEVSVVAMGVGLNKLIAICSDNNLRIWDCQTTASLKGIAVERVGEPTCLAFSKEAEYLLIGTSTGHVLVYDVATLGIKNTNILDKQICKERIQSLAWFHYSGQAQSRRFLVLTKDGNVKLFSFYFQRVKDTQHKSQKLIQHKSQKLMGKANELLLLYINKGHIANNFEICSHEFANFIYFHPGVLLYMVDYYPRIYYPVITSQYSHPFQSLVPNTKKEIFFQTNFLYIDGLLLKRLRNQPEIKLSLDSVLEYKGLKILRMDYRPKFVSLNELPMQITKGVPATKLRYKIMITYYLQNMIRSLVLSDICLSGTNDTIQNLKEYSGTQTLFLGSQSSLHPLIMILQQNRQTITVLNESVVDDLSKYSDQQRPYLKVAGQIYSKEIKIKVQKIFETPFRNGYVVLYLSQNLIRFSNNTHVHADLIDYDVYPNLGLRLDYNDIVIDIVWTARGQIGCVVCLEKVILINDQLKVIRSVPIEGYVIQGQFMGYTLVITTKVDVQYVDVSGQPLQLYCIENYESRYLILGVLADRILGIQRFQGQVNCKMRYFNLMQPLISGYINYYCFLTAPLNPLVIKSIIEGMAPYHIVSEQFLALLNKNGLTNFTHYFIESNIKLYSRSIRAATLNGQIRIERFIANKIWLQHKSKILNLLLYYEDLKESTDNYEKQKSKEYEMQLIKLISLDSLNSIKEAIKEQQKSAVLRPSIANNFGQQALFQVYYEFSQKENIFVKMQLLPFKANDDRQWIGINGNYLQSKIGQNQNDVDVNAVQAEQAQNQKHEEDQGKDQEEQGAFDSLIVYYRFDDGKGDFIDDLSDFHNEASVEGEPWQPLPQNQPIQLQDKWGKKCPPQFSISSGVVKRQKKIGGKASKSFTFQIWIKTESVSFSLLKLGQHFQFGMENTHFYYKSTKSDVLKGMSIDFEYVPGNWTNITFAYNSKDHMINVYLNSFKWYSGKGDVNFDRNGLQLGSSDFNGQFTQFRLWRKQLPIESIKEYLRSPLEIVAQKRKKMRMKIKEKKKKQAKKSQEQFFPAFPF